jgi:hypothetical protein
MLLCAIGERSGDPCLTHSHQVCHTVESDLVPARGSPAINRDICPPGRVPTTFLPTEYRVADENMQQHTYTTHDPDSITWWSWQPGIKPRNAVFVGWLITLLALLLGSIGLVTLVLGIMDNASALLQLPGIGASHTLNNLDGFPWPTDPARLWTKREALFC